MKFIIIQKSTKETKDTDHTMCYTKTITKAQPVAIEFIKGSTTKKKKKRQNETDAKTLSKEVFLFINVVEYEQKKKIVGDIFVLLY